MNNLREKFRETSWDPSTAREETPKPAGVQAWENYKARAFQRISQPKNGADAWKAFKINSAIRARQERESMTDIDYFDADSVTGLGLGAIGYDRLKQLAYDGKIKITDPGSRQKLTVGWNEGWNASNYTQPSATMGQTPSRTQDERAAEAARGLIDAMLEQKKTGSSAVYDYLKPLTGVAANSSDTAWYDILGGGIVKGGASVIDAFGATLAAAENLLINKPIEWLTDVETEGLFTKLQKSSHAQIEKFNQSYQDAVDKSNKAGQIVGKYLPSVVAALPQLVLAYTTGGASAATTGTLQATSAAAQATGASALAMSVANAAKSYLKNPSFQYSFLSTFGKDYEQAAADGANDAAAYLYALLTSAANAVVEVGGGIEGLPEDPGPLLLRWAKSAVEEGGEEVVQGAIGQAMQNIIYNKGNALASLTDENAVLSGKRGAEEFIGGAVVGGVLGGGNVAVEAISNKANGVPNYWLKNPSQDANSGAVGAPVGGDTGGQVQGVNAPTAAETGAAGVDTDATTEQQERAIKAALAAIPATETSAGHADAARARQDKAGYDPLELIRPDLVRKNNAVSELDTNEPRYTALELIRPDLAAINRKTTAPNVVENTAGVDYTASENKEGVSDGSTVHLRESGEWLDGADPAGSVSAVEGGAGQNQSGAVQRGSADGEISRVTYGEEVSAAQLGIEGGSAAKNIRIVTGGETSSINSARQIAQERGLQLTLFAGDNLRIRGKNGSDISARAYVSGNQVFVRADHPAFTANQLMRHEAGHDMIAKDEIDPGNVRERIRELHGAEKLGELSRMYADAYAGSGMTAAEIWEEIICDSLGDMNIFSGKAGEAAAAEMLNETKSISSETDAAAEGKASRELGEGWAAERAAKYTYEGLTAKPDMTITAIDDTVQYKADRSTRKQIVKDAIQNAAAIGRTNESGGVSVYVKDVGADVLLGTEGLKHGLDRRLQENAAVTLKAGELLQNAIRINEVTPQKDSASRAYVLLGVAKNSANEPYIVEFVVNGYDNTVASVDVLYSVNAKKESAVLNAPKLTGKPLLVTDSTISIAQLLDLASKYFPDVLPESVLRHFGYTSRPDGKLGQSALFSRETDTPDTLDEDQRDMVTSTQEAVRAAVREELERMGKEYGWIKPGENPYREVQVPKRTAADNKVSQTVRTIMEAEVTPDTILPNIEELVSQGEFSYDVYSDNAAIADAESVIRDKGYATSLTEWMIGVDKGIVSKANTTQGWALYNAAVNSGDTKTAIDILNRMVEHQRNAAQAVQATRILKKLSPDAQLYAAQRSIRNLQEEINKRYKSDVKLKIDEELAEEFMQAATEEERAEALRQIYRNVGKQVPSRFIDKWNAWRYLALLGNVRTHVRNVVGNAGFVPVVMAKSAVATGLETAASKISGGKTQRSKALVGFGQRDMALLRAAFGDYGNAADYVGAGKYSDFVNMKSEIEEGRRIFKTKWLEKARKANSMALSMEDEWFAKTHYAYALAQYCKANGISAQQITEGNIPDAARLHAIKEAKKATYQDVNQLSELFSRIGRYRGDNTVMQGMSKVVEGILPFRKTPANILARGLEYSPLGIIKTIGDFRKVKSGDATMAEVWDDLASALTGTGLMALGAFAALSGLVRGSGEEDDDEREFNELMGHQSYALELPDGTSITLDWLAPECLPFFVGVNLCEAILQRQEDGKALTMADILGAIGKVSDPMLEMSCLQSLSDVFDSVGYASSNDMNPLLSALASATTSYLTQGLPTLLGQFERSGEETRMTTYTEKNAFLTPDMQYFIGKASSRIPVLDYNQIPYIDAWGRTEDGGNLAERIFNNMFNPAYTSDIDTSQMEAELLRLYEATSDGGVFPSRADKYFNVNKQRKDLTAEEYVKYATARGQTAMEIITDLTGNSEYKKLEDTDKAAVVKLCYELANAQAKTEVSEYQPDGWIAKALKCCEENNIPLELYIICYQAQRDVEVPEDLRDEKGDALPNSEGLLKMQEVNKIGGLTYAQRQAMFAQFGVGKSVILYVPEKVDAVLEKMRK